MDKFATHSLTDALRILRDEEQLQKFLDETAKKNDTPSFCEYMMDILNTKKISKSDLIKSSELSRTYTYQILDGRKKPSRDKVLALCLGAKMTLDETNKALKLANLGELYVKTPRDSILIFAINNRLSVQESNDLLYKYKHDILE